MLTGDRLAHFSARVLADAMAEATADYWHKRGRQFLDAAPRPTDFNGRATAAELAERAERCRATAAACFARASLEATGQSIPPDVWAALREVA